MKNKIVLLAALFGMIGLGACSDFLDETPNKSGSAYIYHMDQLYGLMGSTDLYLFMFPSYSSFGGTESYVCESIPLTDAVEYDPEYYVYGLESNAAELYDIYCWGTEYLLEDQYAMAITWTPSWDRIFRSNTVLANLDNVIQTTEAIRNQVEGEARFCRAYYHFLLLTQYCQWQEDAPGIGYRESSDSEGIPDRQTVAYTLSRINEDLDLAEKALTAAGRTEFDFEHNFRPTVPTVQAFRARVALYRGDYETALRNATDALEAHNTLVAFKDDPEYELLPYEDIYLLNEAKSEIVDTIHTYQMTNLMNRMAEAIPEYKELFLPSISGENFYGTSPISEKFYNLWDRENDARWLHFYSARMTLTSASGIVKSDTLINGTDTTYLYPCIDYETQQWLKPWHGYSYLRFNCNYAGSILGMTTAEMYLIKAECEARAGNAAAAAEDLKTLRRTRFYDQTAAENVSGSVQEILDERFREMGNFFRFYDIKRLNGAENAGIHITREILTDPTDINSVTTLDIAPDDPRWALPFYRYEVERMGWEQNEGWE